MPSRLHIAFFTNNYFPNIGGVPVSIERFRVHLEEMGHRVFIFAPKMPGNWKDPPFVFRFLPLRVPRFIHPKFSIGLPVCPGIFRVFSRYRIDVVHVHHPVMLGNIGHTIARALGIPVVFTYHTRYEKYIHYFPFPATRNVKEKIAASWGVFFCNRVDLVVAPSKGMAEYLKKAGVKTRIVIIPTGVEVEGFEKGDPELGRRILGVGWGKKVLLFVGRLAREKNVEALLDAFSGVLKEEKNAVLALVGDGPLREALARKAEAMGISKSVRFVGDVDPSLMPSVYACADLFFFASVTETQGMVVLEAFAAGAPVVALKASGVEDFVRDGENGFLAKEVSELPALALKVLKDKDLRARLSEGARKTARMFSAREMAKKLEEEYRELVRKKSRKHQYLFRGKR